MNCFKVFIVTLFLISSLVQANESTFDKAKSETEILWNKTKSTTAEVIDNTSEKASEFGKKASEFGRKTAERAKETGATVWKKTKEVGNAAADGARAGASKIRSLADGKKCEENSATCHKNKE
ncbi:hypothetical protein [Marinomonas foliarum]|uniref:Late embryogenesis abundant protein n=1 Tax=Marinomonas foliarum TaxID=491950 RepID=A0A368ZM76_9GAMM|nr:hypothetical protein [Marinomonas foliarum]RCW94403.1 hypothetical protein DFP77_14620 [Marinomonas foliarum]